MQNGLVLETSANEWLAASNASARGSIAGSQLAEVVPVDIAFVDPPYKECSMLETCKLLENSGVLKPYANVYVESDDAIHQALMPTNWQCVKSKKAGKVYFYLYQRFKRDS